MQPRPAHPRGVSAGPRMGAGGSPGGRRGRTGGAGKDGELSSVEGPYSETPALGRVTPRAGEGFPERPAREVQETLPAASRLSSLAPAPGGRTRTSTRLPSGACGCASCRTWSV